MTILDRFGRPLRSLRVSVTDRCNLRCLYCMPEPDYAWLPKDTLLSFEEIGTIADAFCDLGVDRVRLTGGEPLLRRDLASLVQLLAARPAIRDLALTTNGVLLAARAADLRAAGLHRITVSLDTLDRQRFRDMTRFDSLDAVLDGIAAAAAAGFDSLKIDTVVMRGVNDHELAGLIDYGRPLGAEVRFIEYMDVGGATRWSPDAVVSRREMLEILERSFGAITPIDEESSAPGRSLQAARRHGLRHHLLDHRALLQYVRPQPADRRWRVADVPLCERGNGPATPPARRRVERRAPPPHRDGVGLARGSGSRGTPPVRHARSADPRERAQERRAPGDAYEGGMRQSIVDSRQSSITVVSLSRQSQSAIRIVQSQSRDLPRLMA